MFNPQPKPEKREKKRKRHIRPVSTKRAKENEFYRIARRSYLHDHPKCECGCGRKSDQIHHMMGRIGSLLYNQDFFMAVSDPCHKKIEALPEWAKEMGYSLSRLAV